MNIQDFSLGNIHPLNKNKKCDTISTLPHLSLTIESIVLGKWLHFLVIVSLFLSASSCQKSYDSLTLKFPENRDNPYSQAIASRNWTQVENLSKNNPDPFVQLIYLRSLYELNQHSKVIATPIENDKRFYPYAIYLKSKSLEELKLWDKLVEIEIPELLPQSLQEELLLIKGKAFEELHQPEAAADNYSKFLKNIQRGSLRPEALHRMASILDTLGKVEEAHPYYEEIYHQHPFSKFDQKARIRLIETNRYPSIKIEKHLDRIQLLRRFAAFKKASQEVSYLLKTLPSTQHAKLLFAFAQIRFSEKKYSLVVSTARRALSAKKIPQDIELDWRQILASALIRLGKSDEGKAEYQLLLQKKIPSSIRESTLYRLGMNAIDQQDYSGAIQFFSELRDLPSAQQYIESAYWFGAWAHLRTDPAQVNEAKILLERLPDLPQGSIFAPQAFYWLGELGDENARAHLSEKWGLSFYHVLSSKEKFRFIQSRPALQSRPTQLVGVEDHSLLDNFEWQRIELFKAVRFTSWAQLEMDRFLKEFRRSSFETRLMISQQLHNINDWNNLVNWADRYLKKTLNEKDIDDPSMVFRYPRAHDREVLAASREFGVSPFLIWGVMREESRFQTDALSNAGAVGLMQLMPFRGKKIAAVLNESFDGSTLLDPKKNIRFGSYHLREIKQELDTLEIPNDLKAVLMIASYNAGIEATKRWLKDKDISRTDRFIEEIPFQETRQYVKRVLQSAYIYYRLYSAGGDNR